MNNENLNGKFRQDVLSLSKQKDCFLVIPVPWFPDILNDSHSHFEDDKAGDPSLTGLALSAGWSCCTRTCHGDTYAVRFSLQSKFPLQSRLQGHLIISTYSPPSLYPLYIIYCRYYSLKWTCPILFPLECKHQEIRAPFVLNSSNLNQSCYVLGPCISLLQLP